MENYAEKRSYTKLSKFKSLKEFNSHFEQIMVDAKGFFTKSEYIALNKLRKFAGSSVVGVAWAKLQKVVASTWADTIGVSRSTFDRMLAKAKKLNIVSVINQKRKNGYQTHNVYVFNRAGDLVLPQTEVVEIVSKSATIEEPSELKIDAPRTVLLLKLPRLKDIKNTYATQSPATKSDVDNSVFKDVELTPYERFKKCVTNFIADKKLASKMYGIWRAHTCKLVNAPDLELALKAVKHVMYKFKNSNVKSVTGYFNGTVSNMVDTFIEEQLRAAQDEFIVKDDVEWLKEQNNAHDAHSMKNELLDIWGITA